MGEVGFESARVALVTDNEGGINPGRDGPELVQALAELGEGWALLEFLNLRQQITGQRHTRLGGASLEAPVQSIRHVPNRNHLRHAASLVSCAAHVNEVSSKFQVSKNAGIVVPTLSQNKGKGHPDSIRGNVNRPTQ